MSAERLNAKELGKAQGVSRFAALVHTEGCGVSGVDHENIYTRMMLGYLRHPRASMALLLEHGCEKTHNDFMRNELIGEGLETDRFGWASVQMDGGIEKVLDRVEAWFADAAAAMAPPVYEALGLEGLRIGLLSSGPVSADVASGLALLTRWIVSAGGTVLVPGNDGLLGTSEYRQNVLGGRATQASLSIGQDFRKPGFHIMAAPTQDAAEIVTGMGATGVESLLVHVSEHPIQGHPFIPVLQLCSEQAINDRYGGDIDLHLEGDAASWPEQMLSLLVRTAGRDYIARSTAMGNTAFQVSRGLLSVST
jgi:altronate dehydratase